MAQSMVSEAILFKMYLEVTIILDINDNARPSGNAHVRGLLVQRAFSSAVPFRPPATSTSRALRLKEGAGRNTHARERDVLYRFPPKGFTAAASTIITSRHLSLY